MNRFFRNLAVGCISVMLCTQNVYAEIAPTLDFSSPKGISEEQLSQLNELTKTHEILTTEDGLFDFKVDRDPHLCANIIAYNGDGGDIVFPDCTGGVRIATTAVDFSGREDITSVTHTGYPNFVYLYDKFQNCTNLESFTLNGGYSDELIKCYAPDGLPEEYGDGKKVLQHYSLRANKFDGCINLKTVTLPYTYGNPQSPEYSCSSIGTGCFKDCTSLKEIELGGYINIAEDSFLNCTALEKIVFDAYVQKIGDHALGYTKDTDDNYQRYDGLTIYGVAGTAAETYAKENDIPFVAVAPAAQSGDANCDNAVDVSDAVIAALFAAEDSTVILTAQGKQNADLNADGNITGDDVILILRKIAKLD